MSKNKRFIWMIPVIIIAIMTGCASRPVKPNTEVSFAQCKASCMNRSDQCKKTCRNSCVQCQSYEWQTSYFSFLNYAREQYVRGGTIARDVRAYSDPLQCRKTTCSCAADYQLCIQACGGVIRKQFMSAPVCL